MDEGSDGPKPKDPDLEGSPSIPEPTKRRRPIVVGVLIGTIATFAVLAVIGYLTISTESEIPFEEDFSSDEPKFTTDSDRLVDFSVADGAYRILIKDATAPQLARHIFAHTYDGLRFESTVTMPGSRNVLFSVGCWTGDSAYLFALLGNGEVGLLETVSESRGERRPLTDSLANEAVRPAGEPNRLRIDCVGGGRDPTIISGWINGEPVISVAVSDGYDSFSSVGFFIASETDGAEFVVDDVFANAERPSPARSPVSPIET